MYGNDILNWVDADDADLDDVPEYESDDDGFEDYDIDEAEYWQWVERERSREDADYWDDMEAQHARDIAEDEAYEAYRDEQYDPDDRYSDLD